MHELSLAQALVDTAVRHSAGLSAGRIVRLDVRVGVLAGVDVESLTFCFELASRDTPAEGAELRVEVAPAVGRCRACGVERTLETSSILPGWTSFDPEAVGSCVCGEQAFELVGGHELVLMQMELAGDQSSGSGSA